MNTTMITELQDGEVFVFGSNLSGRHGAGAAKLAREKFGAVYGVGEGLRGKSYAFPTLDFDLEKLPLAELGISRDRLYRTCWAYPKLRFMLTKVGCGLAGYPEELMRELFYFDSPFNLVLPEDWR